MTLRLHNTLTREKVDFTPIDDKNVRMYVCGPTVYDFAHIGNARPVVVFDVLARLLRRLYPKVTYVRNITDVDDKINARAQETGRSIKAITRETAAQFHDDMGALGAYLGVMFGATSDLVSAGELTVAISEHALWLVLALVGCMPVYDWARGHIHALAGDSVLRWRAVALGTTAMNLGILLLATAMLVGRSYNPFLYFRF